MLELETLVKSATTSGRAGSLLAIHRSLPRVVWLSTAQSFQLRQDYDGHIGLGGGEWLVMPENLAGRRRRKTGQRPQQGRFSRARGSQQGQNLARAHGQ